jgi:hypothetical protein
MSKAEYYRSSDPLENLKFFLNIREVRLIKNNDDFFK